MHNVVVWFVISTVLYIAFDSVGVAIALGYASHLVLDALDSADYYPLYPWKRFNIRGPVGYFSKIELYFTLLLFLVFIAL